MNTSLVRREWFPIERQLSFNSVQYYLYDYWIKECDPRTRQHFLTRGGPERCLSVMLIWLLFVTRVGPQLMKSRKPMELRSVLFVYNIFMVLSNAYFFCLSIQWLDFGRKLSQFEFPSRDDNSRQTLRQIDETVMYSMTKYMDLLDTIFFVLRKKTSHITFLHIYHHFMVPVLAWITMKIAPTVIPIGVFALLNTFVHTIMYSYYGLAVFGPSVQKYLWWKKYITMAQIIQFFIFITYGLFNIFLSDGYPNGLFWSVQLQSPLFLYLFWDFYKKSYMKSDLNLVLKNQ